MKALTLLALLALGSAGCGDSKKGDNSDIQTPDDQPIGVPKSLGGENPKGGGVKLGAGQGGGAKQLPTIDMKK